MSEPDLGGFGALLRSRRERLSPAEVGLPAGSRRRTPGLRREEVAALANVSVTYYTVLEQGRAAPPSRQVLDALAVALRLDPVERDHLRTLAQAVAPAAGEERLGDGVRDLVDRLDPYPTYVTGRRWDVLAANRSARALFTDWPALPPKERNMLRWMFTDPMARDIYVEWEREAGAQLARFRSAAAGHRDDPAFLDLVEDLHRVSPEVREWWPRHEIAPLSSGVKRLRHRALGEFSLRHVVLQVADDPQQKMVTFADTDGGTRRLDVLRDSVR